jgi:alcohol dehydrogenase class IV
MENGDEKSSHASPERFIDNLVGLINDLHLPSKPSELGLKKEDAPTLLKNTLVQTRRIKTNPRPLDDELLSYIEKGI